MEELETARKQIEKGINIQIDAGVHLYLGFWYGLLGTVHLDSGDLIKAQHHGEEALKISQKNHEKAGEGFAWILLGRTMGKADLPQTNTAEESFFKGIKIYEALKIITLSVLGYFFLGQMYVDTNQKDKAFETLKKAEKLFHEMGMDYWLEKTQKVLVSL
jgi:tetratricopeptide (TPR) repeat protein